MKIEFRKLPTKPQYFNIESDSVKFLGNFSKISTTLDRIDSKIVGDYNIECCRCGKSIDYKLNQKQVFIVSDGIFSSEDDKYQDEIIIESDNHFVDFDIILESELESIKSDYHICKECSTNDEFVDIEI